MTTETLERAVGVTKGVLAGVKADQLDDPTPCQSWKVRELINHIVGGSHFFASVVNNGEASGGEAVAALGVTDTDDAELGGAVEAAGDGLLRLDLDRVGSILYGDCDDIDVARARKLLRPQPMGCMSQPPRAAAWRQRPTTDVVCGADRAIAPGLQRTMAARIPGCAIVEWPDASHSPFLSMPGAVAELLAGLAQ